MPVKKPHKMHELMENMKKSIRDIVHINPKFSGGAYASRDLKTQQLITRIHKINKKLLAHELVKENLKRFRIDSKKLSSINDKLAELGDANNLQVLMLALGGVARGIPDAANVASKIAEKHEEIIGAAAVERSRPLIELTGEDMEKLVELANTGIWIEEYREVIDDIIREIHENEKEKRRKTGEN